VSCTRLETKRLLLRPPELADVAAFAPLIGDYDVAKNLSRVPHPYADGEGEAFVARVSEERAKGSAFVFAVTRKQDQAYMGACGLHLRDGGAFELGYWLGKPYWGQGYATEAAAAVCGFGFGALKVERMIAGFFHDNPASGRVLEKLGCTPDGAEQRDCLARGHAVYMHKVVLERVNFERKRAA
jgi:[ribosomal protein S5]-alanine N-acetyltransferase